MKKVAGGLRLDLAAFRALEAFAQLGTDLDPATQAQLDRGYRMVELLKQPQYKPLPVADQVVILYAGTEGPLRRSGDQIRQSMGIGPSCNTSTTSKSAILEKITTEGRPSPTKFVSRLESAIKEFKAQGYKHG